MLGDKKATVIARRANIRATPERLMAPLSAFSKWGIAFRPLK